MSASVRPGSPHRFAGSGAARRPTRARRAAALALGTFALAILALAGHADAYVYWANQDAGTIGRANLDGTGVNQSFIPNAIFPQGVAVDAEHIYWMNSNDDGSSIGRADLDGTNVEPKFIGVPDLGVGVAVDADSNYIYWAEYFNGWIARAALDSNGDVSNIEENFISADFPNGVAAGSGHVYWVNGLFTSTIGTAGLDGSNPVASLLPASGPWGVAVDSNYVYWANLGTHTIGRANLDGSNPDQSFVSGAGDPQGVAVGSGHVYWANGFVNNTIGRAELPEAPGGPTNVDPSLITLSSGTPTGVAVDALTASCAGQEAMVVGTGRPDQLRGTNGDDVVAAGGGADRVVGLRGDDLVCGGGGADVVQGRGGDDTLNGGSGKDVLRGGRGSDRCRGGGGPNSKRRC
jgi:virginiamycin B lyase